MQIDGRNFKSLGKRVNVLIGSDHKSGDLYELECNSVMPQYFAFMDETKTMRDLRNDNYHVAED